MPTAVVPTANHKSITIGARSAATLQLIVLVVVLKLMIVLMITGMAPGGGTHNGGKGRGGKGGTGACRLMWPGDEREYPAKRTKDE